MINFDLVKVGNSSTTGDAIVFSQYDNENKNCLSTIVIDGGTAESAKALIQIKDKYHKKAIDILLVTHPDADHINGAFNILQETNIFIGAILVNRPWLYKQELSEKLNDNRFTPDGIEKTLKTEYVKLAEFEKLAQDRNIKIYESFSGLNAYNNYLTILGPSRQSYIESTEQHLREIYASKERTRPAERVEKFDWVNDTIESDDKLLPVGGTTPKNETSLITRISDNSGCIILTGDASAQDIEAALNYADENGLPYKNCQYFQLPHHGSYNCISRQTLARISPKMAFVSAPSRDDTHPSPAVLNSCYKLNIPVYSTRINSLNMRIGALPNRDGYSSASREEFRTKVERYKRML